MPSSRKRIGYLPSVKTQEVITKIAKRETLSQSKVVGILVEEALIARGMFDNENPNNLISKVSYGKENNRNSSTFNNDDIDELISDKGIIYNTKKYKKESDSFSSTHIEDYNQEIFEQFKQFILFQKRIQEK